jgi:hypothetical protein
LLARDLVDVHEQYIWRFLRALRIPTKAATNSNLIAATIPI